MKVTNKKNSRLQVIIEEVEKWPKKPIKMNNIGLANQLYKTKKCIKLGQLLRPSGERRSKILIEIT